jgi:hypothetical protein
MSQKNESKSMKVKRSIIGTVFIWVLLITIASAQDDRGNPTFYNSYIEGIPVKFYTYEGYKIKPTLKLFDKKNTTTPEDLLWSLESCKSQEWFNELWESPEQFSIKDVETGNPDSNYIELLQKIVISRDGSDYCVIKFSYKSNHNGWSSDYRLPACLCMRKKNGHWKFISGNGFLEPYYNLMFFIKTKYLEQIFIHGKSEVEVLNKMINNSRSDGSFNISQFYVVYQSLFNKDDYMNDSLLIKISDKGYGNANNITSKSIKESIVNTKTCARLDLYQKGYRKPIVLYKGVEGEFSKVNQELLNLINKSESNNQIGSFFQGVISKDTTVDMAMIYKMELEYFERIYALIKYKARKNNQTSFGTIVMEVKGDNYTLAKLPKDLNVWYDAVNRLKPDLISKIKSSSLKPENYVEYFPIKEKSFDETGRLNITLLVKTLNEIQKTNPELYKLVTN